MTTTGASFFDSFIPSKESNSPYTTHTSQGSNNTSTASIVYETKNHLTGGSDSDHTPIAHQQLDQVLPLTPEPTSKRSDIKMTKCSVYEDYLPEWQMLSESYSSQKQVLHNRIKEQLDGLQELETRFEKMSVDFHRKVEMAYTHLSDDLTDWQEELEMEKSSFDREKERMRLVRKCQDEKIKLNVGGQLFETSLSTLRRDPNSTLAAMFDGHSCISPDETDGSYFIDRDSTYFRLVLNYLRDLKVPQSIRENPKIMDELMQEARHYQITGLLKLGMTEDTTKLFLY